MYSSRFVRHFKIYFVVETRIQENEREEMEDPRSRRTHLRCVYYLYRGYVLSSGGV